MLRSTRWSIPLLVLAGCGAGPDATLTAFLDASLKDDRAAAYALLCPDDRAELTAEAFAAKRLPNEPSPLARYDALTKYEIVTTDKGWGSAMIEVAVTGPDAKAILGAMLSAAVTGAIDETRTASPASEDALRKIKDGDVPISTITRVYELKKADGAWCVAADGLRAATGATP